MDRSLENSHRIAFTWSPKNIQSASLLAQYQSHVTTLSLLRKCAKFVLYPEHFESGDIHYHGCLDIFDKVKWFKSVLPTFKRQGFCKIKKNPDEGWTKYIQKDKFEMEQILEMELPITEHDFKKSKTSKLKTPEIVQQYSIFDYIKRP